MGHKPKTESAGSLRCYFWVCLFVVVAKLRIFLHSWIFEGKKHAMAMGSREED